MKKELKVLFLFASLFLVMQSVFAATESSSGSDFTILGCDMSGVPGDYADLGGNECSPDGLYYCQQTGGGRTALPAFTLYKTTEDPNACVGFNNADFLPPNNPCCPGGTYECTDEGGGEYLCRRSLDDCSSYTNKDDCENPTKGGGGQCYWYAAGNECLPRRDQCYDILTMNECNDATIGPKDVNCRYGEFEVGGVTYLIAKDTCICEWTEVDGDYSCGLTYTIQKDVFGTGLPTSTCSYSLSDPGVCGADGFHTYTYEARYMDPEGIGLLPGDSLCFDREGRRACGEPVVRVPFFSFFNVLVVLAIIGIFYVLQSKRLSKKKSKTKSHTKKKR